MSDLPEAVDRLETAMERLGRVIAEEAAWWAAGCPPRETDRQKDEGSIGRTIGRLRRSANLTQHDVAFALSISRAAVAQWETGRTDPPARRLPDIARLLNCNINQLFEG